MLLPAGTARVPLAHSASLDYTPSLPTGTDSSLRPNPTPRPLMTDAADIIARETDCTPTQAKAAVAALVACGWKAPAAPPGRPAGTLTVDSGSHLVAHTDGACSGNPGPGGWAVVFSQDGEVVEELSGGETHTTNNKMELIAIREAIRHTPGNASLEITTDSQNAIGWLSQNWKRKDPKIAALCADIDQLRAVRSSTSNGQAGPIVFTYVRGHDGDPLNERADRLATGAIPKATEEATKGGP